MIPLDNINTKEFVFDPKEGDFVIRMIKKNPIFDLPVMERHKWLTYITLVYDINSEIRRNNLDNIPRKAEAAQVVGFETDENGNFGKDVEEILLGKNEDFNKAVIQYIYYMYNNDYKRLYLLQEQYDLKIRERSSKIKIMDDKEIKALAAMSDEIERLEQKIFKGQEIMDIRRALYEGLESSREHMPRSEDEIQEFEKSGLEPWSPYPGYTPEKLEFIGDKIPIDE